MQKKEGEYMIDSQHRCWTEINLETIKRNYLVYKERLKPDQQLMAVIKADAYGHGDKEVAAALQDVGCLRYAVSNIQEAFHICEQHLNGQILILGYTPPYFLSAVYANDFTQAVLSEEYADLLLANKNYIKCQFAIDTGMNRIGLDGDDPKECARIIRKYAATQLNVNGIFTHLCVADADDEESRTFTEQQIEKFKAVAEEVKDLNLDFVHCLNTAGGLWHNQYGNLVRLGISLYGLKPDITNTLPEGIEPALEWKSVVSMVKDVFPGETIGYGRTYLVNHPMRVATVSVGYADGYSRLLSNNGYVLINGKRAPIVGRVCMDQMMVDVTEIPDVHLETEVVLIGKSGDESLTADELGNLYGTIGYEVVCGISKRVERVYFGS